VFNRTIITVAAAVALGCMPVATNALATPAMVTAADNAGGGYARGGHSARYGGGYYRGTDRSTTLAMATMATAPQVSSFPLSAV
jgi:hypothetical protein